MADHDRDAGSRGEEEAPRDPTPEPSGDVTREGPAPDSPGPSDPNPDPAHDEPPGGRPSDAAFSADPPAGTFRDTAHTRPAATPGPTFGDFVRQRHTQIFGAALIGLIVGALLGGIAVAVVSNMVHRGDRHVHVHDRVPYWRHDDGCRPVPGGTWCRGFPDDPRIYPMPVPSVIPKTPLPTPKPTS
ncbi:hypothetical protein ACIBG8_19890 [Nonomuraea sp. NPDC050556]|uniref:hypothetical protein n=1 Tax=Nonomuraea sp. NPDC050556 TaxID=3364369 RepID=UPI0037A65F88